jgi:hypothetical protein
VAKNVVGLDRYFPQHTFEVPRCTSDGRLVRYPQEDLGTGNYSYRLVRHHALILRVVNG